MSSGVATGWHGWTMSMGPGAKGAPRQRDKKENGENKIKRGEKKKKEILKREEKKRENKTFQIPGRGAPPYWYIGTSHHTIFEI